MHEVLDGPSNAPISAEPSPPESGKNCQKEGEKEAGCYWYAEDPVEYHEYNAKHEKVGASVVGMEYSTSIPGTPETKLSSFEGAHSIDQLLVGAHLGKINYKDTIEAGWDADPEMFELEQVEKEKREVEKHEKPEVTPHRQPHFFIFVNPDEYSKAAGHKNCYDCDFIASGEPKYTPGAALPGASEFRHAMGGVRARERLGRPTDPW